MKEEEKQYCLKSLAIGSTVRVTRKIVIAKPGRKRRSQEADSLTVTVACRSIVAMLPDDNGNLSLVNDGLAPVPIGGEFLIAPTLNNEGSDVNECEAAASDVMPLLEFEQHDHMKDVASSTKDNIRALVHKYKGYGDQLFRLDDYTCAVSYYEAALHFVSSKFGEIGGTLIVKKKGHCVVAEVDYVEDDEGNDSKYDVTFLSGEEATIAHGDILLAVWTNDVTFFQTRILLNLSRCLLKLAHVDTNRGDSNCSDDDNSALSKKSRREKYTQSAVLGSSIAISLCDYLILEASDESARELKSLVEKARLLRSRAFIGLRKFRNATVDAKKVLCQNPSSREAQSILSDIKAINSYNKLMDKRLSKEVCRWVQSATEISKRGAEATSSSGDSVSTDQNDEDGQSTQIGVEPTQLETEDWQIDRWRIARMISMEIFSVFAFVVVMWAIYVKE
mmetsp:Transcript_22529/g.47466  ORF Transcript_22529/g.47466 Transcript_22529/m.47466 type:complete len:448 (+) Transcript_22529:129-1472(+)